MAKTPCFRVRVRVRLRVRLKVTARVRLRWLQASATTMVAGLLFFWAARRCDQRPPPRVKVHVADDPAVLEARKACMVKGGEVGGFAGGSLEHPRQWLGAQWDGLLLGVPSCPEPPGAP